VSGETHVVAEDDKDALDKVKTLLGFFPSNNTEPPPRLQTNDDPARADEDLDTLIPVEPFRPFDVHEVIRRIVDHGNFFEIFKDFAPNIVVGFARFDGRPVGIVASQPKCKGGVIDCDAADKIARFVRFCDLFNIPLVNLHDVPGYMIGPKEEWKGILRHGAKTLYAYIDATVPKITIIMRKSYAGAYLGLCSKDTGADFLYAWPTARVSIVGGATAASVIFAKEIKNADDPAKMRADRIKEYETEYENPYEGAKRGYIDDVILPRDTRKFINRSLDLLANKKVARPYRKYSNINL
jgi:acetyl-CoA carboxylase carboxyltransferase component